MDLLDDVWNTRDFPVLREVTRRLDAQPRAIIPAAEIASATGLSERDVDVAYTALHRAGLVNGYRSGGGMPVKFTDIDSQAYVLVGLWPSPEAAADRLIEALKKAIEDAPTPEEKSRRQKILSGVLDSGRDFAVSLAAGVLGGQLGA